MSGGRRDRSNPPGDAPERRRPRRTEAPGDAAKVPDDAARAPGDAHPHAPRTAPPEAADDAQGRRRPGRPRLARAARGGPRPVGPDTRRSILAAARRTFAARGYDGTTIRAVAAAAGVDAALVHHYFGTKENLFRAVVQPPLDPDTMVARIFAGGAEELPERLVAAVLGAWEDPVTGPALKSLFRSAIASEGRGALIREFYATQVARRLVRELQAQDGPEDSKLPLRASLVASHLLGIALARYVVRIPPLADVPLEEIVTAVTPSVRRCLFGELGE